MSRLTDKKVLDSYKKIKEMYPNYAAYSTDELRYCKLGKLEDLEEELGCPLEVVFGFLTHNITEIIIEYDDFSGNYASPYCTDEDIVEAYVSSIYDRNEIDGISKPELVVETNMGTFPLSDYKEHWWLKKDKSE